jgi:pimeloyl-ACP methyl ester carboxylesterase
MCYAAAWMGFQRHLRTICAVLFTPLALPAQYFGELVDIGGRRLYISCSGSAHEGIPTVILLSGRGSDSRAWAPVQPFVSTAAKTCSYDRAGLAKSDPGPANADGQSVVSDLHKLLGASKLQPPFVLVGHSLGGLIARLYASRFPEEVKGMVFVDSYSENERRRMRQAITQNGGHSPIAGASAEDVNLDAMDDQARKEHWSANIPIIILSRDAPNPSPTSPIGLRLEALRQELQAELATRSKRSEQRVIAGAGHFIHHDNPAAVMRAVRDVLAQVGPNSPR